MHVDYSEITKEKCLSDVFFYVFSLPHNPVNLFVVSLTFVLLSSLVTYCHDVTGLVSMLRWLHGVCFPALVTLLGVMISALAILVALPQGLFIKAALISSGGVGHIKANVFSFVYPIVWCLLFVFLSFFIALVVDENGPFFLEFLQKDAYFSASFRRYFLRVLFVFYGTFYVYCLCEIKSLVFNIAHLYMSTIRYAAEYGSTVPPKL